jgi:adenylyltransferase/sulfurtransferase
VEFETTVGDLKERIDRGNAHLYLLDVREPREYDINRIEGSILIPLGELNKRIDELPTGPDAPDIIVYCKSGIRSAKAVNLLREKGFARVQNLRGGILEWIARIDPSQPTY